MQQNAVSSIRSLATKGYIPSLMALGNMLANGNIVNQNLPEAKKSSQNSLLKMFQMLKNH